VSKPLIVDYVADKVVELAQDLRPTEHLDMGAGWGHLIERLRVRLPQLKSCALDYNPSHFPLPDVPIAHVDFNRDRIPHADQRFDLVTCTEVFEHLENYRHAVREAARVLQPGGVFVVSTPNVLTAKSRWAFLTRGFFTFFDPLPLKEDPNFYPGQRHITPIPFFYLAHALYDFGFEEIQPHSDRTQRSSSIWAALLWPLLHFCVWNSLRRRRRRYAHLPEEVESLAALNNSWTVLTGRTIIISARKKIVPA